MRKLAVLVLTLFLVSDFAAALISYNPSVAWPRFALIILGLGIFVLLLMRPERLGMEKPDMGSWWRLLFAILPTLVIAYFILTNDWTSRLGKLSWLDPVLRSLVTREPLVQGFRMNSNSFGGVVAGLVPLQLAALLAINKRLTWVGLVLLAISAVGLLLSESRGAWIALAAIIWLWTLWKLSGLVARRWFEGRKRQTQIEISASVLVLVTLVSIVVVLTPFGQSLLQRRSDRLMVWRDSLDLATDYPFTGLGLGGFTMAYSSYVLLLHVPYLTDAHNLYLDIWLEQGLTGSIAFAGLIVVSILPLFRSVLSGEPVSRRQVAALASLGVVLLHGLVDDPFYGYGGMAIPLLFIPLGLLAQPANSQETLRSGNSHLRMATILGGVAAVSLALIAILPGVRSAFISNMGALGQTRAELSVYSWPAWSIQDQLRRSDKIDLANAVALYKAALAIDPSNATANRRLGQIELSRGEYDEALQNLEAAFVAVPDQRATSQLLGELYAINGQTDQAKALWKRIDVGDGQLEDRAWWYEHIGEFEKATQIRLVARVLENQDALRTGQ